MNTGSSFSLEVALTEGERMMLRHIRADDAPALCRMFDRLSPEARYQRFFGSVSHLTPEMLHYLTWVDGRDHVAIVALSQTQESSAIIGVARFIRMTHRRHVAEAAIAVIDDRQRQGIGTLLLATLRTAARERAVEFFRLEVLRPNTAMRRLLDGVGARTVRERGGEMTYYLDLERSPLPSEESFHSS